MKIVQASIDGVKSNPKKKTDYIDVYWENEEGEFGHISLSSQDTILKIDSEYMGRDFVKKVFEKLIDDAAMTT